MRLIFNFQFSIFNYIRIALSCIFFLTYVESGIAREGMWLPQLLSALNEQDMKSMGMQISAEDIYSVKQSSLKDAVLQFGGGCTGELISGSGLLITNHHCGYSQIQSLSSIEKNYLKDGFWAMSNKEEIPCPGLTATFIRDITDVTDIVLKNISDTTAEDFRTAEVQFRSDSLEKSVGPKLKGIVRPFYGGNKYYLFTTEVYTDVRFVGAPPQQIGKFGGETDNWMWPRHTGDFALFRIYADKDNQPATYSSDNVPYQPKRFLTINIGGVKENDFVFVFGFPGRTNRYLLSPGMETIATQTNPNRIAIRDIRLNEMRKAMRENDTIQLQYSSKFSTLENSYKKWKGELLGFRRFDVLEKKKNAERKYEADLNKKNVYMISDLVSRYDKLNSEAKPLNAANDFYVEAFSGVELLNATSRFNRLIDAFTDTSKTDKEREQERQKSISDFRNFYRNYNRELDQKITTQLFAFAYREMNADYVPAPVSTAGKKSNGDFNSYTEKLFSGSLVTDSVKLMKLLKNFSKAGIGKIKKDPAYKLMDEIAQEQRTVQAQLNNLNQKLTVIQREYLKKQLSANAKIFPDANSTLRVSYGRVEGMIPNDGMRYDYFTSAEGILHKSQMDVYDYQIPRRLADLIQAKDYGPYGKNGILPVGFLASAHTTGGNSGSPVLNAKGELVGLNFDRMWEGVLSDYYYDETYCRNICLDIRFALFVIEKYGNAGRIIEEMKIVN